MTQSFEHYLNADDRCESSTWMEVIVDFFENRVNQSKLFKAKKDIEDKSKELENAKDEKKINRLKVAIDKKSKELIDLRENSPLTEIRDWLNKITNKDNKKSPIKEFHGIAKATHVLKFSHSSSVAASIELTEKSEDFLLTTSSLKKDFILDLAHNDGSLITISRFLALSLKKVQIFEMIQENKFSFLEPFKVNEDELENWKEVLSNVVHLAEIKTADKAKQIYIPINNASYHLIIPLFASSLAEEVYAVINSARFGEDQKNAREQAKQEKDNPAKYYSKPIVNFANFGTQKFGGEYPRNISMLNADRGGKAYLLSSEPPAWQSQLKPPIFKKSLFFESSIYSQAKEDIDYLRDFLLRFQNLDLSIKNPERKKWVERWVGNIIDEVFFYVASIQDIDPGWSANADIKLANEHQYLLDPYRADSEFQAARAAAEWLPVICADFARWLNLKLTGKDKQFTPQAVHTRLWRKLFEPELRVFNEELEFNKKHNLEARI